MKISERDPERQVDEHHDERHQRDRERRQGVAALEQHPAYAAGAGDRRRWRGRASRWAWSGSPSWHQR